MSKCHELRPGALQNFTLKISRLIANVQIKDKEDAEVLERALFDAGFEVSLEDNRLTLPEDI